MSVLRIGNVHGVLWVRKELDQHGVGCFRKCQTSGCGFVIPDVTFGLGEAGKREARRQFRFQELYPEVI
jgi:hypothetical protein